MKMALLVILLACQGCIVLYIEPKKECQIKKVEQPEYWHPNGLIAPLDTASFK